MVFEISLNRAYPLTDPGPEGIHPNSFRRATLLSWQQILVLTTILLAGMIWLLLLWSSLRERLKSQWIFTLVTGVAIVATMAVAMFDHMSYTGEPFTVLEGISNWPTTLLRLGVALFCIFALTRSQQADTQNSKQLADRFGLGPTSLEFRRFREWARKDRISYLAMDQNETDPLALWARCRWLSLVWQRAVWQRAPRVICQVLIYLVLCGLFLAILGPANEPHRGPRNEGINFLIRIIAVFLAVSLFWYVVDANRLCIRLIHLHVDQEIVWPEKAWKTAAAISGLDFRSLKSENSEMQGALTRSLNRLTTMVILADRTEIIGRLMYYPALAYLLLFLARSPFFDQYAMPYSLILIYTTALLGVFCCSAWLPYSARWAKRDAVVKVREEVHDLRLAMSTREQGRAEAEASATLEEIAKAISKVRKGAFSPLGNDPFLHTLLMILGGIGAVLSLEPIQQLLR